MLVTGGNLLYTVESPSGHFGGLNHVYTFDPFRERWTRQPDMDHGRWYPSQLLMPDGRTLIIGGLDEVAHGDKNEDLELFTPARSRQGRGRVDLLGAAGRARRPGPARGRRLLPAPVLDAERPRARGGAVDLGHLVVLTPRQAAPAALAGHR